MNIQQKTILLLANLYPNFTLNKIYKNISGKMIQKNVLMKKSISKIGGNGLQRISFYY